MKIGHYIAIALSLAVIAILYYFGDFTPPRPDGRDGMPTIEEAAAMQRTHQATPISFDSLLQASKDALPAHAQEAIKAAESKIETAKGNPEKATAHEALATIWREHQQLPIAAFYYLEAGKLANSEKKLNFAAQLFLDLARRAPSEAVQAWEGQMAIDGFTEVLAINPHNDTASVLLAECYIGTGQTMQGVLLLREVTERDPDNIQANLILGQQGMVSGQVNKAIERFETVLAQQPESVEAMLGLAEAYKSKGDKNKAIEILERSKKIMNNPDYDKDIDNYIKTF